MSRNYDNWEKLVEAVLRREKDRQLALCESVRTSFDSAIDDTSFQLVGADYFAADAHVPAVPRIFGPMVDPTDLSSQHIFFLRNVMAIEYEEIQIATSRFALDMLLVQGGFGLFYKGWIHEHNLSAVKPGTGLAVAVKKWKLEGGQGHEEWFDEINYMSQLRHSNIVRLIGYSFNKDDRIVVYEFMAGGNLNNHLFRRGYRSLLWATRIRVALGAARALAFLHGWETPVVHGNIRSSNIFLDGDFNPKLSDFCLARGRSTYGYAAPEYIATGDLTTSCDVYGFGVFLLELVTGLEAHGLQRPTGQRYLLDWAIPYFRDKRRLSGIMDHRLEGQYPRSEAYTVGKLALQCVYQDPKLRPNMSEVVVALEKL